MNNTENIPNAFQYDWVAAHIADHSWAWAIMASLLQGAHRALAAFPDTAEVVEDLQLLEAIADAHRKETSIRAWNNRARSADDEQETTND